MEVCFYGIRRHCCFKYSGGAECKSCGARIAKIAQPEADELLLTLKSPNSGQVRLLLSASASLPLIYFTSVNKPSPVTAPAFCMLLRKHIGGGKIMRVYSPA